MIYLNIVVEGPTEETFVRDILAPYWGELGIFAVARSVETARKKGRIHRGGGRNYRKARQDILTWLKQQKNAWCTTMFDLYGIYNNFPTYGSVNENLSPYERVRKLEKAFAEDIADSRFIPYLQLHEFETILFTNIEKMNVFYFDKDRQIKHLIEMAEKYDSPELINESEATAPSKRIISEIPEYESNKVLVGPKVARAIGLEQIRMKCLHFNEWLCSIESLVEA
ncbi:DUF4276 family protein [Pelotomaculum propionicicum]|uniref:DUF4276 domain-containing protein n=1 Tax=Pelotomaculum propionicicum TaxID=258475 RepID=A0A4Y7RM42_9FIRM|nr:DUF4276 family protein [Pelotomaculum propionicicum]NLI13968.1 DUF4276 family protein [Peptococcaceae bacterium]TEB09367.1 hypothetical protein Pmgp_03188 [Pelotomaculum propionicicum]